MPNQTKLSLELSHALTMEDHDYATFKTYIAKLNANPLDHEAAHAAAVLLRKHRLFADAYRMASAAEQLGPSEPQYSYTRAVTAFESGDIVLALSLLQALEARAPTLVVRNALGVALLANGQARDAVSTLKIALASDPLHLGVRRNLAIALDATGDVDAAWRQHLELCQRHPDVETCFLDALKYGATQKTGESVVELGYVATTRFPMSSRLWMRLSACLDALQRYDEAIVCLENALAQGRDPTILCDLGVYRFKAQRHADAIAAFEEALTLSPDLVPCHVFLAMARLAMGDFERGWYGYTWRLRYDPTIWENHTQLPLAAATTPSNSGVLLTFEQGLGDDLQFSRFVPLISARFPRLKWRVRTPLLRLLKASFSHLPIEIVDEPSECLGMDAILPMMSMPEVLGITLDNLPATAPYLRIPQDPVRQELLLADNHRLRVGLVWAGRSNWPGDGDTDRRRSLTTETVVDLLTTPGIDWVSLQLGRPEDMAALQARGIPLQDFSAHIGDFADTAVLVSQLDLVIAVDTAVAHLAGALGKPVWLLNRFDSCWRWMVGQEDSPWYPTLRIFRQSTPGDWAGVVARVQAALAELQAARLETAPTKAREGGDIAPALAWARAQALQGDTAGAEVAFLSLPQTHPKNEVAWAAALDYCFRSGRYEPAPALIAAGLATFPRSPALLSLAGDLMERMLQFDAAIAYYRQGLALVPDDADLHRQLGVALSGSLRYGEAILHFKAALAQRPDDPMLHTALAESYFALGDFASGWQPYEWRMAFIMQGAASLPFASPQTSGWAKVVVMREVGFGDELQFVRFLPDLHKRFAHLRLWVRPALRRLFEASFSQFAEIWVEDSPVVPEAGMDAILPIMSAPFVLGITLDNLATRVPYLTIPQAVREKWRFFFAASPRSASLRVGIAWSGRADASVDPQMNSRRSLPLDAIHALLAWRDIEWINLQLGRPDDLNDLCEAGYVLRDCSDEINDFADTAGIIEQLDLVIAVDTAVAHLAGALGKPVWLLNRFDSCWRWMVGREDSPWYPTMRIFRQSTPGDWAGVIARVQIALAELQAARLETAPTNAREGGDIAPALAWARAQALKGDTAGAEVAFLSLPQTYPKSEVAWAAALDYCFRSGRYEPAPALIAAGLATFPRSPALLSLAGDLMERMLQFDAAIAYYRQGLALFPDDADLRCQLGVALSRSQRYAEALDEFSAALVSAQQAVPVKEALITRLKTNLGQCYLGLGDFARGWEAYAWRTQELFENHSGLPFAEPTTSRWARVLVTWEQGFGDDLQFCRFLPLLHQRFAHLALWVRPPLLRLFEASFGHLAEIRHEESCAGVDAIVPLMNAPWVLGTQWSSLPATVPYLRIPEAVRAAWQARLAPLWEHHRPRVGLVWAGRRDWKRQDGEPDAMDARRSLPVEAIRPLLGDATLEWVSLQLERPAEIAALHASGYALHDFSAQITDFADTAAIIETLDLVIAADTAVAHLAAALGKPVWLLSRYDACWRWMVGRADTPWYPTMRIFRQPTPEDWGAVIDEVIQALSLRTWESGKSG